MSFWTYMLHCRGGYFYVGQTDDLDRRMAEYAAGQIGGFVRDHWPAELVWSAEFPTRLEALDAETRIKGWSRAKKMALIRSDWGTISKLAKGKGSPSTGSGRTETESPSRDSDYISVPPISVRAEPVEALSLVAHPSYPPKHINSIQVEIWRTVNAGLQIRYWVMGDIDELRLPAPAAPLRTDQLWQTTCFELFLSNPASTAYREYNFSPSTAWAAYDFRSYRDENREDAHLVQHPSVTLALLRANRASIVAEVQLDSSMLDWQLGLAAVIEEKDGTKSYWALKHPPGAPDFHHADCFQLTLPAPGGA